MNSKSPQLPKHLFLYLNEIIIDVLFIFIILLQYLLIWLFINIKYRQYIYIVVNMSSNIVIF